jgi:hypothetical protein
MNAGGVLLRYPPLEGAFIWRSTGVRGGSLTGTVGEESLVVTGVEAVVDFVLPPSFETPQANTPKTATPATMSQTFFPGPAPPGPGVVGVESRRAGVVSFVRSFCFAEETALKSSSTESSARGAGFGAEGGGSFSDILLKYRVRHF